MDARKYHLTCHRVFWAVIALVIHLPSTGACTGESATKQITVQLKWKHQFQFAGFYAALDQGYYQDSNLDVVLKEGAPGITATEEVMAGRADFGIASPAILLERNSGMPVVVLAAIFQHSAEALFAKKASGIASPHDMIGKRILMRPHVDAEILAMFKNEGIIDRQLQLIEHTWQLNDLIDGKVDVYGGYLTDVPYLLQERGIAYSIISPLTYGIDFYGDCLFTSETNIARSPSLVDAFLKASLKGWEYAMNNTELIIDLILEKYSTRLSRKALQFEASAMQELMQPKFIEFGHMNPGRWKHMAETFVKVGMLEPDYSLEGLWHDPNRPPDYTRMVRITWMISLVALITGLITIILLIFNRRLNFKVAQRTEHLSTEIKERGQAQQALKSSLKEKDILLKEVHHRVKNNLQMVESLLNLQLSELTNSHLAAPILDSKNRVRSMALVHETLYRSGEFAAVDIKIYIEDLVNPLIQSMTPRNTQINISYGIEQMYLDLDTAIACGLIINELVNNALKHAFKHTASGEIFVNLNRANDNRIVMQINDTGQGMPPEKYKEDRGTLGLQIVRLIAEKQLEADVTVESEQGLAFTIEFSLPKDKADEDATS